MTTTDSNGLIQFQEGDLVTPLEADFNAISSSVSTSLDSTVRVFKVASDTERNTLATQRIPSASNPLVVFNSASGKGYQEINTGSGWSRLIPANGVSGNVPSQMIQHGIASVSYTNGTNSTNVSFPTAFSSIPNISLTVETSNPNSYDNLGIVDTTSTGFAIRAYSSSAATFNVHWIAIGDSATD